MKRVNQKLSRPQTSGSPVTTNIFVFGSNLAGRHGAGAAKFALQHHGAIYGQGWGLQGNSFAIPTKGYHLEVLSLDKIEKACSEFMYYAEYNPQFIFDLTPIGCGLAGYRQEEIKPFFEDKPHNVHYTKEWVV